MNWTHPIWWRGGLLPITTDGYYIFGRDARHRTLIDLGGHREHFDADLKATATREAAEESLGLIQVAPQSLQAAWTYQGMALFPVHIPWRAAQLQQTFQQRVQPVIQPEVIELVAVPSLEITEPMYWRTWRLLNEGTVVDN